MNLYLDDDTAERLLVTLLRKAGHAVTIPAEASFTGVSDARHFVHAIQNGLTLVTRNHDDFLELHEVVRAAVGTHPGILIIRSDNDPTRDLSPRGIAAAIG